ECILCVLMMTQHAPADAQRHGTMAFHEGRERGFISPSKEPGQQLRVARVGDTVPQSAQELCKPKLRDGRHAFVSGPPDAATAFSAARPPRRRNGFLILYCPASGSRVRPP